MALVLVVDDEFFIRDLAVCLVEELGHVVVWARDVVGAVMHLNQAASIEMLITDIRLDDSPLGGYSLAQRARELHPRLSVLYVSGQVLMSSGRALFVENARFLQKPYTPDELQDAVRSLLPAAA